MSTFDDLLRSRLPITWTVIRMAWPGLSGRPAPGLYALTTDDVLAYAWDQIGVGPPEQEAFVGELAFADARDTWTIQRCLDGLAPPSPEKEQHARRIWRWVLLNEVVTEAERAARALPDPSDPIYGAWWDDFQTSVVCAFQDFWKDFEFPRAGLDGDGDLPGTLELVRAYRRWLTEEAEALQSS